jgi:hypothetical protein
MIDDARAAGLMPPSVEPAPAAAPTAPAAPTEPEPAAVHVEPGPNVLG